MLFSAAGLVCTLLILIVFVTLKDHPVIKASSRGLSCILLVGIMVSYGENFLDLITPGNLISPSNETSGKVLYTSGTNKYYCQHTFLLEKQSTTNDVG